MTDAQTLTLRSATPSDRPFLLALYTSIRADEFAQLGWPVEMERAFMRLQFEAQRGDHERRHPGARCRIVELQRCPVGQLWMARDAGRVVVLDFSVIAELRGQGIGTECLRRVQRQAAADRLAVELEVVGGSSAQRLYERLGFRNIGEAGVRQAMRWQMSVPATTLPKETHQEQA